MAFTSAVIAIDIGGTKISGALVNDQLDIVQKLTVPSRDGVIGIADPGLVRTHALIAELLKSASQMGVEVKEGAAGFPEYVNLQGELTTRDNIDWQGQPKEEFERVTGFPWVIESDVRCAGTAEARIGSGKDFDDFVYITVSSGISHTHFLKHQAQPGIDGSAIGFGVHELELEGAMQPLENYASGLGLARRYARLTGDGSLHAPDVIQRSSSDSAAEKIVTSAASILGSEIARFASEIATHHIVIGGGLWLGSSHYRDLVRATFDQELRRRNYVAEIYSASVADSGVIGAAIYAFDQLA